MKHEDLEQLELAAVVGFDLNLFENLPMTSRKDILTWLDKNKYQYKEFSIENSREVRIQAKGEGMARIQYEKPEEDPLLGYTMIYHLHEDFEDDLDYRNIVRWLMERLHEKGSYSDNFSLNSSCFSYQDYFDCHDYHDYHRKYHYYDDAEEYWIFNSSAERSVYRKAEQSEIDEQTNQLICTLNEVPKIKKKKKTLAWIAENSDSYEDCPEVGSCDVYLGIWRGTYYYKNSWSFEAISGNPEQYYRAICEKLNDAGYEGGEKITEKDHLESYYTRSGELRIEVSCYMTEHYIALDFYPE